MRASSSIGLALLLATTSASSAADDPLPPPPTREELRRILQERWAAIRTLEFKQAEVVTPVVESGKRPWSFESTFKFEHPNRRAFSLKPTSRPPGAKPTSTAADWRGTDIREDGTTSHQLGRRGDVVDSLQLRAQTSTESRFDGPSNGTLVAWMPGGRAPHDLIDEDAIIESERGPDGTPLIFVTAQHRNSTLRVGLDPTHDYLPRAVRYGEGDLDLAVNRYEQQNGIWFPVEGQSAHRYGDDGDSRSFRVTSLAINRPIPDSAFALSALPDGTRVTDHRTGEKNLTGIAGLEQQVAKAESKVKRALRSRGVMPRPRTRFEMSTPFWVWIVGLAIAAGFVGMLAVGGLAWAWRRSRR